MPLWVFIASLLVVCACAYLWVLERRARSKFAGIPTYPLLPFIGNVHQVLGDGKQVFQHMDRIARICDDNMSPFVVWLGPCSILVTHDPDDVKSITNAFVEKPYYYSFGRIWLGDGLVTAPGVVWKHNIKKLAGTFTSSVVDGYLEIFNAQARRLVENLRTEVGKGPFDVIHKYLAYTTLETICQTALGVSMISESIVTTEYYDSFNRCLELIIMRAMNVLVHPDCIYRLTPAYREMVKCVAVLHNVSDTVMKKRKQEQKDTKKSKNAENNNNASAAKFKAFLDILLELHETDATLTEQQVRSEVDTIIVGGQETVASTLFYTMLMLGSKPRVQDKMYAELRSIFGDSSSPVSKEDLSRMVYCEAIINETLRLYPPVPGVLRYADRDLPLKSYTIPKGTAIAINAWGAGRSERVWGPDAKEYRPERWLEDQTPGQPGAFLAFSYGRRACIVTGRHLVTAIGSFRCGSAGGLDGLSPQHLKDLTCPSAGEAGESLLKELTALTNLMLSGKVDETVIDVLYGANLCALRKKDGGIRPIAVGTTYRRMVAKICSKFCSEEVSEKFQPLQLGYGSKGGCEAAVHALSTYLNHGKGDVILKVDIKNAFNSVNRDTLLAEVKKEIPKIYSFLWQCYRYPTKLLYRNNLLESAVGCQQGDPLGPVIFSLAINPIIRQLNSEFNVWYLDDGTLGGNRDTVLNDLIFLKDKFHDIGLDLNLSKCELFIPDSTDRQTILQNFLAIAPEIKPIDQSSLCLLGSPILEDSFSDFIEKKIQNFNDVSERLLKINMHAAITIIRYCCFGPKLTYNLRASHLWKHTNLLDKIDEIIRHTLSSILNVALDDRAWSQATLPIRMGGLGVRKISSVSLPAFISSVHGTEKLIRKILPTTLVNFEVPSLTEALNAWKVACPNTDLPANLSSQRQWDEPLCRVIRKSLIDTSMTSAERARLLAVGEWESGLWLLALPSSNTGTMFDDTTFRLAVCLRLGAPCCSPHRCHCGEAVNSLGHHGLSCSRSAGRIPRHANINDVIRRALVAVGVPAVLEPNGLARDDGKRPDGMSLFPWKVGRTLVWDATCVDTLAPSHLPGTACRAGSAAAQAENLKRRKYSNLIGNYMFEPFGVETLGPWGPSAHLLARDISQRLVDTSRDPKAGFYFAQRLSIAIQRGNAASLLGTLPSDSDEEQFFDALY